MRSNARALVAGIVRALKSTLAWASMATGAILLVQVARRGLLVPPIWWTVELLADSIGAVLPFAAVAGGISLTRCQEPQAAAAAISGLIVALATYLLMAVLSPLAEYAAFAWGQGYGNVIDAFGIQTPDGILRNLRYVLANVPSEYSLSAEHPDRFYPNRLLLFLHLPVAAGAIAFLNTFVGLLLGKTTASMRSRPQRRTRWSIGLLGALVLVAVMILMQGPDRDWENVSGVVAAWTPAVVPLAGLVVLAWVHRRVATAPSAFKNCDRG